ncbi:35293_t:CDS:2 [Gigaspora margarita]|uniref:35293_t:CDS:1 n=1 Tax=Gigaspora margarita TaxID=4874 RepID=A0ABN7UN49_GIGMA|nr:35293_t:CDS:2 [Gigaspora margarita]
MKSTTEVDNTDNTEDNNVNNVKDHQPKTKEPVQANQDSETNYEDKGSSAT